MLVVRVEWAGQRRTSEHVGALVLFDVLFRFAVSACIRARAEVE